MLSLLISRHFSVFGPDFFHRIQSGRSQGQKIIEVPRCYLIFHLNFAHQGRVPIFEEVVVPPEYETDEDRPIKVIV